MLKKLIILFTVLGGLAAGGLVTLVLVLFVARAWWSTPFEVGPFGGSPEQPISYPHTIHAGSGVLLLSDGTPKLDGEGNELHGLGLDCTFCHRNVDKGESAGVPPVEQCIYCHKVINSDEDLPEVALLIKAWENKAPVVWERIHRLPDHVRFVHEAHIRYFTESGNTMPSGEQAIVAANVCAVCHGDVGNMEEVKQVRSLKMGDCVDCHRDNGAPTDCTTCHY